MDTITITPTGLARLVGPCNNMTPAAVDRLATYFGEEARNADTTDDFATTLVDFSDVATALAQRPDLSPSGAVEKAVIVPGPYDLDFIAETVFGPGPRIAVVAERVAEATRAAGEAIYTGEDA